MKTKLHVTVWNEGRHEKSHKEVADVYPKGIHAVIAEGLGEAGFEVGTTTLDEPEHGLSYAVLKGTDVLIWWGHMAHGEVSDTDAVTSVGAAKCSIFGRDTRLTQHITSLRCAR